MDIEYQKEKGPEKGRMDLEYQKEKGFSGGEILV